MSVQNNFSGLIHQLEQEVAALKAEKLKASSTMKTVVYQETVNFTIKSEEMGATLNPTQIARITATSKGGEEIMGMVGVASADDDGRYTNVARTKSEAGTAQWVLYPNAFLESDYDGMFTEDDQGYWHYHEITFNLSYRISIVLSSECDISISYEDSGWV